MRRIFLATIAGFLATAVGTAALPAYASAPSQTIVGIASTTPGFETLTAAVTCTGLVPALNGTKRYTVFAPTNDAFAKLGLNASNVCSALPTATLKNILLYHVTRGTRVAKSLVPTEADETETVNTLLDDQSFEVNSKAMILTSSGGSSQIVATNIRASNGVIHVIDTVLMPGSDVDQQDGGDQGEK